MCLTGVDYFSTLGYQPGIAALAAGAVAPLATLVLVVLTLFGALPVYRRVACESPHGQGSIAMLQRLLPSWRGKLFVLVLLGFAVTDFMITITLSASDAAAHVVENPHVPAFLHGREAVIAVAMILVLGLVFLRGFNEAIGVAVALVVAYLALNAVVLIVAFGQVVAAPEMVGDWRASLTAQHGNPWLMIAVAVMLFPQLALGMSGFETGVAVMTHVEGDPSDDPARPAGRIRHTGRLLTAAALVMSLYLLASSLATTWLIPAEEFEEGGEANGRALAYLAHDYLGEGFGTLYDVVTIAILWFAGASAMAGLLTLIPRYLPRYGMAPQWAAAARPLVAVLTVIAVVVVGMFDADVDAQGGAYATGVLVLITSAAVAVTLAARRDGERGQLWAFGAITLALVYTTASNIVERPDGVRIAGVFIALIVAVSIVSRAGRSLELRTGEVVLDERAEELVRAVRGPLRLVAHHPGSGDAAEYRRKLAQIVSDNALPDARGVVFVEVRVTDPSDFEAPVTVRGTVAHGAYRVLRVEAPSVPNALAALLLRARDLTGARPHVYFEWTEGHPLANLVKFWLLGHGEMAPLTREVLRRAEPDPCRRPHVHVG
ncbi:MAG: amino acid transporter [Aeromicrobium sp.]